LIKITFKKNKRIKNKEESVIEMIAYTKNQEDFGCDFP
jgi:hypothetical protein